MEEEVEGIDSLGRARRPSCGEGCCCIGGSTVRSWLAGGAAADAGM